MSENTRSRFIQLLGFATLFLLVFYVLSIGPVCAFLTDSNGKVINPEHERMAIVLYTPLISLIKRSTWLDYLAGEYVEYCVDHF